MTAPAFSERARDYFAARAIHPEIAMSVGVLERDGRLLFPYRAQDGTASGA